MHSRPHPTIPRRTSTRLFLAFTAFLLPASQHGACAAERPGFQAKIQTDDTWLASASWETVAGREYQFYRFDPAVIPAPGSDGWEAFGAPFYGLGQEMQLPVAQFTPPVPGPPLPPRPAMTRYDFMLYLVGSGRTVAFWRDAVNGPQLAVVELDFTTSDGGHRLLQLGHSDDGPTAPADGRYDISAMHSATMGWDTTGYPLWTSAALDGPSAPPALKALKARRSVMLADYEARLGALPPADQMPAPPLPAPGRTVLYRVESRSVHSDGDAGVGDGIPDDEEIALGLNPFSADTDGDGVKDNVELSQGKRADAYDEPPVTIEYIRRSGNVAKCYHEDLNQMLTSRSSSHWWKPLWAPPLAASGGSGAANPFTTLLAYWDGISGHDLTWTTGGTHPPLQYDPLGAPSLRTHYWTRHLKPPAVGADMPEFAVATSEIHEYWSGAGNELRIRLCIPYKTTRPVKRTFAFTDQDRTGTNTTAFTRRAAGTLTFTITPPATESPDVPVTAVREGSAPSGHILAFRQPTTIPSGLPGPSPSLAHTWGERILHTELMEDAPEVLRVNSDFDEQRIGTDGFAIPDCEDADLKADRNAAEGGITAGSLVTLDLHEGWFGISPGARAADFFTDSTVTLRKVSKVDPTTGVQESGEVRFWVTKGSGQTAEQFSFEPAGPTITTPPNLTGTFYGLGATVPRGADVRYWMEGTKPGKITLEFRYKRGDIDISHTQTFLVATHQTKKQWLDEIRDQIQLQSIGSIDLKEYLPVTGWRPHLGVPRFWFQKERVAAIYNWYGQLFQQYPDRLDWMGAAALVGGAVYGGLSDIVGFGSMISLEDEFMGGQILIYRDLGWQHRAWVASGLWALDWVDKNDPGSVNAIAGQPAVELDVWRAFDVAMRNQNWLGIKQASRELALREQSVTIKPMWDAISVETGLPLAGFLDVAPGQAKNPSDPDSPKFLEVVPGGRLENFDDRFKFAFGWAGNNLHAAKGVFPVWWGEQPTAGGVAMDTAERLRRVRIPIRTRAAAFSITGQIP